MDGSENQKNEESKMTESPRRIDSLALDITSWWKKTFIFVKKTEVATWKGALVLTFVAGVAISTVWGYSADVFQGSSAGTSTSLSLDPPTDQVQVDGVFDLDAIINTDADDVVAVRAIINFDKAAFELQAVDTSNSTFAVGNTCTYNGQFCQIVTPLGEANTNGRVEIVLANPSLPVNTQSGVIATLTFKALQITSPGSNNFTFSYSAGSYDDSDMIARGPSGADTLDNVVGAMVSVVAVPQVCTDFTYTAGPCLEDGTQVLAVATRTPQGCTGGTPETSRSCTYIPGSVAETCTSFVYSAWSACSAGGSQTRTITASSPEGCAGGTPEGLEQDCTPTSAEEGEVEVTDSDRPIKIEGEKTKFGKSDNFYSKDKKISFQGESSDIKNGKVKIYSGNDLKKEADVNGEGKWKTDVKLSKDGDYKLKLEYYSSAGEKVAESKRYQVKIDTEDPEFSDLPLALNKKRGDKVWWKAKDDRKIDEYKVEFLGRIKHSSRDSFNVPVNAPKGLHTLKVTAYDKAGNSTSRTVAIWVR